MRRARRDLRAHRNRHRIAATKRLLGLAKQIIADSTATQAVGFDTERWFGRWIHLPQSALCERTPYELLGAASGEDAVRRVLGALVSGAYQ